MSLIKSFKYLIFISDISNLQKDSLFKIFGKIFFKQEESENLKLVRLDFYFLYLSYTGDFSFFLRWNKEHKISESWQNLDSERRIS